ncbi:MAG: hypothetical protein HC843_13340 [Sphingomonadales bacterium]|nr:hypothetical protein [Sphingomonadales bacterium]
MNLFKRSLCLGIYAAALAASPALADDPIAQRPAAQEQASYEADRADILAMAGDYRVSFDMRETTSWREDYTPIDPKMSGGFESVRMIKDTGREIVLQHLLVASHEGKSFVIKHWRQDWVYEPETILTYKSSGKWELEPVPEAMRRGRWSQTVYQVDDSPRYAGWGQWRSVNGVRQWRSNWTARPLARRDAVRSPVYDHYIGINRHQPFPGGWIHWQDNTKMKTVDGKPVPYVQEMTLNTYTRYDGYDVAAADNYWQATQGYWAAVRAEWDAVIARNNGVSIEEEAQAGTVISGKLLEMADSLHNGEIAEADAITQARSMIRSATSQLTKSAAINPDDAASDSKAGY